jgi:Sec23/Sec24 zinc finger/Sec23/Sec24 trunk domain
VYLVRRKFIPLFQTLYKGMALSSLEQQLPQQQHLAARYRSDQGAVFSSSKCPPGAGQTCGLPFGFLWTPLAPTSQQSSSSDGSNTDASTTSTTNELPPGSICITCLAYINLYCKVDLSNGRWTCALCQSENVIATAATGVSSATTTNAEDNNVIHSQSDWLSRFDVEFRQSLDGVSTIPSSSSPQTIVPPTQRIVLVIDQNLPAAEALAVGAVMQQYYATTNTTANPPLYDIEWGLIIFGKHVHMYHVGSDVASGMAAADVVYRSSSHSFSSNATSAATLQFSDTVYDENDMVYLGRSLDTLLTCLSASFGVVRSSSSYNENPAISSPTATDLLVSEGTDGAVGKKSRLEILKERKQARLQQQQQKQQQQLSTDSERSAKSTAQNVSMPPKSPWLMARERAAATAPPLRCTGKAIQCAIDLMTVVTSTSEASSITIGQDGSSSSHRPLRRHDRILLFTNGCPNVGDGSVVDLQGNYKTMQGMAAAYATVDPGKLARASEFYDVLAKAAAEAGIAMDVFCTGVSELGLPAYQSLVEPSSGYVLLHDSFAAPHLLHNVQFVLVQTRLLLAQYAIPNEQDDPEQPESVQNLPSPSATWVDAVTVDIRMSSFLDPSHLIGPGDLIANPDGPMVNEELCFEQGLKLAEENLKLPKSKVVPSLEMLESSLTRIRLGRYDPLSTFSVMLSLNDFFQHDEYALFQCIVRHVDRNGQYLVTRVTTHRLSVAATVGEFLEAIDEEVVPVLLGKEAVYRSMFGLEADVEHPFQAPHAGQLDSLADDAQRDLDNTVFRISGAFRLLSLEKGTRT